MKILIVEDDPASRTYLSETIKSMGFDCACAEDGKAGLEAFARENPDLLISDIRMPNLDGLEMLAKIRKENTNVIVIMMTAFGSEDYALEALRKKANDYLPKPVRHEVLIPLIKKYAEIIQNRTVEREIIGMVVRRSCVLRFDNRLTLVPRIVDRLMQEAGPAIPDGLGVHLGLVELLANAIEHGNLGITYQEKTEAMANFMDNKLESLIEERIKHPRYASRRVTVEFNMDQTTCEWLIQDEGEGFDWKSFPDPTNEDNLLEAHGRGILLSRFQFDTMEYRERGNIVLVQKKIALSQH